MPQYLLRYVWEIGDEDPAHDYGFQAKDDKAAVQQAKKRGRKGDTYRLYREIETVQRK